MSGKEQGLKKVATPATTARIIRLRDPEVGLKPLRKYRKIPYPAATTATVATIRATHSLLDGLLRSAAAMAITI